MIEEGAGCVSWCSSAWETAQWAVSIPSSRPSGRLTSGASMRAQDCLSTGCVPRPLLRRIARRKAFRDDTLSGGRGRVPTCSPGLTVVARALRRAPLPRDSAIPDFTPTPNVWMSGRSGERPYREIPPYQHRRCPVPPHERALGRAPLPRDSAIPAPSMPRAAA